MADDVLDINKMNVDSGGKHCAMHYTVWKGRVQTILFGIGVQKGMYQFIQERVIDTTGINADQMFKSLAQYL